MTPGAGNLMVLGFEGLSAPDWVRRFADNHGLGGVILFARNCPGPDEVAALAQQIHGLADPTPLVMIDQEGGRVERLRNGVKRLPSAAAMAQLGESAVEELAYAQSVELRAIGVDVNLAPVCDVVRPGESGAIGDRAWGDNPGDAGRLAAAFYRGLKRGGLVGCAKHFPGHGASVVDTHLGAGRVEMSEEELFATDLPPFQSLVDAGVEMVMACHLSYPALSEDPACYSQYWLGEVLRRRMGFRGVTITDDMEMGAAREAGVPWEVAARAVNAGADMLIYGRMLGPEMDLEALALKLSGVLDPARVAESTERIAGLRSRR